MKMAFVALKSVVLGGAFLWLWSWVALSLARFDGRLGGPLADWTRFAGFTALAAGGALAAWCVGAFVVKGHGTPAPFDSPTRFVAVGPYRHVRNPMCIGGACLLLGLGLSQRSPSMVLFVPAWWLLAHALVVLHEEPALRRRFGPEYEIYVRRTPRWIPR